MAKTSIDLTYTNLGDLDETEAITHVFTHLIYPFINWYKPDYYNSQHED